MSERAEALTKLGLREVELSIVLTIPVTAGELVEDRLIGALSTYAADLMWVREAGFRKLTIPTDDLLFLHNEVQQAADVVTTIHPSEVFGGLTCGEAQALADVFAAAGRTDAHDFIINEHGRGDDDPEDDHHNLYLEARNDNTN
jgi:hypothetical protein